MVKEFWKSIRFWQSYHHQLGGPFLGTQCSRWNSTGCRRRLCLRLLCPLTFWPNQYVSCRYITYVTQFWWKYLQRYCIHPVFRAITCSDLDLWPLITKSNQHIDEPNPSLGLRYGVHKVFWSLPGLVWPWRLTFWPSEYVPGPDTYIT